jgi:hypothetical protein
MSGLSKITHLPSRRDDIPNPALAKVLAANRDRAGIGEIAENLWNQDKHIQSECLKVLCEIGAVEPELVARYADDFLELLHSQTNRLVWGSMRALSSVVSVRADYLYLCREEIQTAVEVGTMVTADQGIKILALIAGRSEHYRLKMFPYLLAHLRTCRSKDVPSHAESIVRAVNAKHKEAFISVLETRLGGLSASGTARVKRVMRAAETC